VQELEGGQGTSLCSNTEQIFQVSGVIWGARESLYLELCECSIAAPLQRPIVRRIRRVNLHRDIHRRGCEQRRSAVRVGNGQPSRPLLHSHVLTSGSAAAAEVAGGMAVPSTRSVEAVSSPMAPRLPRDPTQVQLFKREKQLRC